MRDFLDCVRAGRQPPIGVFEALDFTVPGLVSRESLHRGGVPVAVPDFRTLRRFPDELPAELRDGVVLKVEPPARA